MKNAVFAALILISLIALNIVCVLPARAQYQGNITINADGSLSPSTAPIQVNGDIYTLTSDIDGSITVNRSNTVIDGKNYALSGGILIRGVSNVTVEEFVVTNGEMFVANEVDGILLDHALQVTVTNNTISGIWSIQAMNGVGFCAIDVWGGGSNVITGNSLLNNGYGIIFSKTQKNLIVDNMFVSSMIKFWDSSNNTVYHNNFIDNSGQLANNGDYENPNSINVWDNGYPSGGNYWADYASYGAKEIDLSGIGNKPYIIDTKNSDRYPLMKPFNSTFFALQTTPPKISIRSPTNQTYDKSSVPLDFSVDVVSAVKAVNWTGYSLDGKQNVTITGNTTLTGLSSGFHNVTVYANDTYGNMAASETVTFTISLPFPVVPVAAASVATIAAVGVGLLVYFKKCKR
jgi:parallel beta-helix repeat protein